MRCVIALMQHETNTFSTIPTTLKDFAYGTGLDRPPGGDKAIEVYGNAGFPFSAMLDIARIKGADITVPIAAYAEPSGVVDDEALDAVVTAICNDVAKGCDAVLLDLHGAMVTKSWFDAEGELLSRIRQTDPDVPIAVALDFHTNLTSKMVQNATVIDGYRTYPHVDMYETGERAANSLFNIIESGARTRICWQTLPMMTHMIKQTPLKQPMYDIMNLAITAADQRKVLNASVFGGFPLADIPYVSLSALTVELADQKQGEQIINELCEMAWHRRAEFIFDPEPLAESIGKAKLSTKYPVVIADHGDNCGAGGSADDMSVLKEMLDQGLQNILAGPVFDPGAVAKITDAGEGAHITIRVGGNHDVPAIKQKGFGLILEGEVIKLTSGRFKMTGPMQTGLEASLGRTAVLRCGSLYLVVCEKRWEPYDLGCFTHAGIDPEKAHYILIKSRQHFRAAFEPIAGHVILAAGPGICSSDYSQFQFNHIPRPVYPIDLDMPKPMINPSAI